MQIQHDLPDEAIKVYDPNKYQNPRLANRQRAQAPSPSELEEEESSDDDGMTTDGTSDENEEDDEGERDGPTGKKNRKLSGSKHVCEVVADERASRSEPRV